MATTAEKNDRIWIMFACFGEWWIDVLVLVYRTSTQDTAEAASLPYLPSDFGGNAAAQAVTIAVRIGRDEVISFRTILTQDRGVRLTSVAELRAGSPRRPPRGTLAAATDECLGGSEMQPA